MPLPATNWSAIHRSAVTGTRTLLSLRRAVAAFRPDVLHVQCFGPNGAYATALSRVTGLPLVVTLQGETLMDDADIFETSRVLRSSLRAGLRSADAVTGCSAFTLADAEDRFGLERGRGQVIVQRGRTDSGPSMGRSSPAPAGFGADLDRPYILALGRVVEKKGFDLLLAVVRGHRCRAPDRRSWSLPARGRRWRACGTAAVELGIDRARALCGRLSRDEVAGAMAGATLFVMPSRLEPFGIVILEAWRAGTAVVATNRGGAPEFVRDGADGVLVDPVRHRRVRRLRWTVCSPIRGDGRPSPRPEGRGCRRSGGPASPRPTARSTRRCPRPVPLTVARPRWPPPIRSKESGSDECTDDHGSR